jgi:3-methyladenine DNA glycosylase Tag
MPIRCEWVKHDPLEIDYHDREWGVPVHDDRTLFEFLKNRAGIPVPFRGRDESEG